VSVILIADDDQLLCELLRFKLEGAGYVVRAVHDGEAAVDAVRSQAPDAIVLDSMMPVLTGPEVLHILKGDPETATIPIIMLTARRGEADIIRALRLGVSDYLTKPFLPEELHLRIQMALARSDRARSNDVRSDGTQARAA
jgi:DNA-binding response OmpR family regulator